VRKELWHRRVQLGQVSGWLPHECFRSRPLLAQGVALAFTPPSGALSGSRIVRATSETVSRQLGGVLSLSTGHDAIAATVIAG